jgi:hypothetical protein
MNLFGRLELLLILLLGQELLALRGARWYLFFCLAFFGCLLFFGWNKIWITALYGFLQKIFQKEY